MTFTENESFKHKLAKELLCKWLKEKRSGSGSPGDGVHLEYPLIPAMRHYAHGNLLSYGYYGSDIDVDYYKSNTTDCAPSYSQCILNNDIPLAVLDIAVVDKGCVFEGFEVYHTHRVDYNKREKIMKLTEGLDFKLYEISAEKILCQTKVPDDIYKLCDIIIDSSHPQWQLREPCKESTSGVSVGEGPLTPPKQPSEYTPIWMTSILDWQRIKGRYKKTS